MENKVVMIIKVLFCYYRWKEHRTCFLRKEDILKYKYISGAVGSMIINYS